MTAREIWYQKYREKRAARVRRPIPYAAMLKECYGYILYGKDQVKYNLISRYESKASPQLLFDKKKLREKAKVQADDLMKNIVYAKNPLLDMMSKSQDGFNGKYIPVPITYP